MMFTNGIKLLELILGVIGTTMSTIRQDTGVMEKVKNTEASIIW